MKRILLPALIVFGLATAIPQVSSLTEASRTPEGFLLSRHEANTFKTNSPPPTPPPPGGVLRIPLTPETYQLVCRGGTDVELLGEGFVVGTPPDKRDIGFIFKRGTKPAPGETRVVGPWRMLLGGPWDARRRTKQNLTTPRRRFRRV